MGDVIYEWPLSELMLSRPWTHKIKLRAFHSKTDLVIYSECWVDSKYFNELHTYFEIFSFLGCQNWAGQWFYYFIRRWKFWLQIFQRRINWFKSGIGTPFGYADYEANWVSYFSRNGKSNCNNAYSLIYKPGTYIHKCSKIEKYDGKI